jgi:hypothetical protein
MAFLQKVTQKGHLFIKIEKKDKFQTTNFNDINILDLNNNLITVPIEVIVINLIHFLQIFHLNL